MPLGPQHTVIFDLDGTLVDTAPDLCRALNFALERQNRPRIDQAMVRKYVGFGALRLIRHGIADAVEPVPDTMIKSMERDFLDYYKANIAVESRPFPGAVEALERYARLGARLGVCTNKREDLSRLLLNELNLARYFHSVIGADTLAVRKPDPGHLLGAIERAGGSADSAVMVGDSATDVATARAAGLPVVVVSFGYTEVPAAKLGGDRVIDHFDDLDTALVHLL